MSQIGVAPFSPSHLSRFSFYINNQLRKDNVLAESSSVQLSYIYPSFVRTHRPVSGRCWPSISRFIHLFRLSEQPVAVLSRTAGPCSHTGRLALALLAHTEAVTALHITVLHVTTRSPRHFTLTLVARVELVDTVCKQNASQYLKATLVLIATRQDLNFTFSITGMTTS
jgi:hypothetical protein